MTIYENSLYRIDWDNSLGTISIIRGTETLVSFPLAITLDIVGKEESEGLPRHSIENDSDGVRTFGFVSDSSIWSTKTYTLTCRDESVSLKCLVQGTDKELDFVRFGIRREKNHDVRSSAGYSRLYVPRFDWSNGIIHADPWNDESLSCHQWLSPPPFFFGWKTPAGWCGAGLEVSPGNYSFLSMNHVGGDGFHIDVDYEGHTTVNGSFETPALTVFTADRPSEEDALNNYVLHLYREQLVSRERKNIPSWWREPMFCGWGQQRLDFRTDHDGEELGNWVNAGDYATEAFYRHHLSVLESKGVNPGIVVVDCFWAAQPSRAEPHPLKWLNLRGFIDEQHGKGRKVLLWLTPILTEGLPVEACMKLEGKPVAADPTSKVWKEFFGAEIRKMISGDNGCLNADGFKVDFTQNIPAERGVFRNWLTSRWSIIIEKGEKTYQPLGTERRDKISCADPSAGWGVELIKLYLGTIRANMKAVKPDSLLITHTANPYFSEDVDMLRLNDMDGTSPDVLEIMSHRAAIARACDPGWLIDTDNDQMINKDMWRRYIALQSKLGNPDTYYATGIAQSGEMFSDSDYALLRDTFEEHRSAVRNGQYAGRDIA